MCVCVLETSSQYSDFHYDRNHVFIFMTWYIFVNPVSEFQSYAVMPVNMTTVFRI